MTEPGSSRLRDKLRELLAVASGGVDFTTMQQFLPEKGGKMPCVSKRRKHHRDRRWSAPLAV